MTTWTFKKYWSIWYYKLLSCLNAGKTTGSLRQQQVNIALSFLKNIRIKMTFFVPVLYLLPFSNTLSRADLTDYRCCDDCVSVIVPTFSVNFTLQTYKMQENWFLVWWLFPHRRKSYVQGKGFLLGSATTPLAKKKRKHYYFLLIHDEKEHFDWFPNWSRFCSAIGC